jgi:chromosome segregation ATPase
MNSLEEVKMKELQIFDLKKKITEAETKLKQQQNLYEAVRSDRNLYSKNLIEAQDEITEMKRKLKIMNHQIEQLKQEISSKESGKIKDDLIIQRL